MLGEDRSGTGYEAVRAMLLVLAEESGVLPVAVQIRRSTTLPVAVPGREIDLRARLRDNQLGKQCRNQVPACLALEVTMSRSSLAEQETRSDVRDD